MSALPSSASTTKYYLSVDAHAGLMHAQTCAEMESDLINDLFDRVGSQSLAMKANARKVETRMVAIKGLLDESGGPEPDLLECDPVVPMLDETEMATLKNKKVWPHRLQKVVSVEDLHDLYEKAKDSLEKLREFRVEIDKLYRVMEVNKNLRGDRQPTNEEEREELSDQAIVNAFRSRMVQRMLGLGEDISVFTDPKLASARR